MKLDSSRIRRILINTVENVKKAAIDTQGVVPKFWQLYLDADVRTTGLDVVDTCATSQALMILINSKRLFDDFESFKDIICEAVASLVRLRDENGAWPSCISVQEMANLYRREGDIALGDNFYALSSLIAAGFLDSNFEYVDGLSDDFKSLSYRFNYFMKSLEWFDNYYANDEKGWYYTTERIRSVSLTTINILMLFSETLKCLNDNKELVGEEVDKWIGKLKAEIKKVFSCFSFKSSYNTASIGKYVSSPNNECNSVVHTCKLVDLILYNLKYNGFVLYDEWDDLVTFVLNELNDKGAVYDEWENLVIFEKYTLHKQSIITGIASKPITVDHENYVDSIILHCLINALANGYDGIPDDLIDKMAFNLVQGFTNGLVKCRSTREKSFECPVYTSCEAFITLNFYDDICLISKREDMYNVIELKKAISYYIEVLQKDRVERYGSVDIMEMIDGYIIDLENIARGVNNDNFIERQTAFISIKNQCRTEIGVG